MDFSLKKSYKSHNSYKHLKKLVADKSNHGHEQLPMLFPHHHDDSKRAVDLSDHPSHREEVIVKIYDGDSSATKGSETTGGKIWRENSYEFWKDQAKSGFDFVRLGSCSSGSGGGSSSGGSGSGGRSGGGQSSNAVAEEEKDPPSKLIKQFLHKQKASGEMSLDMDLEMDELRHENDRKLPPVSESPLKAPPSRELRVSFKESEFSTPTPNKNNNDSVRRRFSYDDNNSSNNNSNNNNNNNNDGVTWTSNASVQRKSSLLRSKTRSRLMDPTPAEMEKRSGRVPRSGQVRSGMLQKMEDEDDDPFLEDDMPNEFKGGTVNAWTILQWLSLVVIIGALACTLSIHYLWHKNLWTLRLWKWEVLALVLICGRLVSGWGIRIIVFFIERNFLLRKRVLYFVYGVRKPVQNCLWLGLVLMAWHFLFVKKVERETKSYKLKYFTKVLVCMLVGTSVWLVKTLVVKVLASSFHVSTYFNRIHESLFNQYVIETLSGPPLIEIQNAEDDEFSFVDEVRQLQNAGATMPPDLEANATMPPDLKANAFPSMKRGRVIGSGGLRRSSKVRSGKLSRTMSKEDDEGITIDHLHKLNPKNVSALNMKRLMRIVRHGTITTLDEQILETTPSGDEDFSTQIRSEVEAKAAAKKIFQNGARHGSKFIYMEDLMRFLREDEAVKTLSLFEGASETRRISKSSLKNWVVNAFRDRRALALTLNDTKTAVNKLHLVLNILVGIGIFLVWLLILGIATTKFLLYISSQLVLVAFIFGNTCKTVFEAIIFLFVMHPYDVGDRCEIEGVQMVVEEMNILTTVFLRYDNTKLIYPNSVLATKPINNFYRSPDMGDSIEFCVHIATPADKIAAMRQRIISYVESKEEHWCAAPMIILMEFEELHRLRLALWLTHKMNYQDMGEKFARRSLLMEEMVKIFRELDIQYRLLPVDINVCAMPPVISTRLPTSRDTEQLKTALEREVLKLERQAWPNPQSLPPVGKLDLAKIKCEPDHLTIPNDGTDVWEIDPKHLTFGNETASGSFGDLYKGTYCSQEVAIKALKPERVNSDMQREFAQEVFIMRNFVQFIGACTKPPSLCIITEYMPGGSVYDFLHKQKGVFKLPSLIRVAIDVSKGMDYLHKNNIIHRDLKAANLLMDENEVVKVADFEVARIKTQSGVMTAETGTYRWMAPEVIEHKPYDHKADVFSFAIVLWELLTGKLPYEYLTPVQAAVGVVQKGLRPIIPKHTHPKLAELLEKCWLQDPALRPDFSEIIEILQQTAKEVGDEGEGRHKEKSSGGFLSVLRRGHH